jgi:hypothetical protein
MIKLPLKCGIFNVGKKMHSEYLPTSVWSRSLMLFPGMQTCISHSIHIVNLMVCATMDNDVIFKATVMNKKR